MDTFFAQVTAQAPSMCRDTLDRFFETIRTRLEHNLIDQDYVPQGNIFSDFEMRIINQLLCYNYEHMDLANEQEEEEVPKVTDILLAWMNELAVYVESHLIGGNNVEMIRIQEVLQNLLTPIMQEVWHGCYHCGSFFKREDWFSPCPRCDGWLCVEVDSNVEDGHHKFKYTYTQAVPWEFKRLTGSDGVSGLRSFEEFEMVDNRERKECPICIQSDGHVEDGWKLTFCKHILGYSCLEAWLNNNLTCPVCRSEFPGDNDGPLAELFDRSRKIRLSLED
ncbi:hypothetical protein FRX31_031629 [Thalictrum thalictroides]|uniref:RING-type domain-containing protein n=1 Tax=Thalictrum thalictroides TaxID=46969 RepID=A0A7J6V1U9_THATH|nr:hypothetical protein FRX31_031629 [Thalictrum thalictroides]